MNTNQRQALACVTQSMHSQRQFVFIGVYSWFPYKKTGLDSQGVTEKPGEFSN
jgi:hypothetical protein